MKEIWKTSIEYRDYEVSNLGNVRKIGSAKNKNQYIGGGIGEKGYWLAWLRKNNKGYNVRVHRMMAKAFINGYREGLVTNHIDGNSQNNNLNNLEWVTQSENIFHAVKMGRMLRRSVKQYTINNKYLATYLSITDALRAIGASMGGQGQISNVCNKKPHKITAYGYKWRWQ